MQALQAQNLMWAPAAVTVSMFFVNIAFNASLVSTCGFKGAAYAQSASRIAQFLLLTGQSSALQACHAVLLIAVSMSYAARPTCLL